MKQFIVKVQVIFLCSILIQGCSQGYDITEKEVTFHGCDEGSGCFKYPVKGADIPSFKILSNYYAKDKNQAYYAGNRLVGSDPASFNVYLTEVAYDKNRCYYYWEYTEAGRKNAMKDLPTEYIKSNNTIIYKIWRIDGKLDEQSIPGVDVDSFTVLSYGYAKDKNHVYWSQHGIFMETKYDAATFTIVNPCEVKDKNSQN